MLLMAQRLRGSRDYIVCYNRMLTEKNVFVGRLHVSIRTLVM